MAGGIVEVERPVERTLAERLDTIESQLAAIHETLAGVVEFVTTLQRAVESHPLARSMLGR